MTGKKNDNQSSRFGKAVAVFKECGGILRTTQALRAGIHPTTLYAMRDDGTLEIVSRGVYRLSDSDPLGNPEKTLADCFKFRNRIGLDTAVEAVRFYRERMPVKVDDLIHYSSICRVKKIIRPYLEAIL